MVGTARYSEEFKQDAIKLVASTGRSINSVAPRTLVSTPSPCGMGTRPKPPRSAGVVSR